MAWNDLTFLCIKNVENYTDADRLCGQYSKVDESCTQYSYHIMPFLVNTHVYSSRENFRKHSLVSQSENLSQNGIII